MSNINRRSFVKGSLAAMLAGTAVSRAAFAQSSEPITLGVSGPLTGPNAQYGAQWKQGFDLALDEIHAAGGINGRKLVYVFEDSQSDPRQSVAIAQKFVSDPKIVMELGDFSSPASMAASPIYQRAGLVQFGFTNSHPDFTKGGDFMWSTSVSQADEQPLLARYAVKDLGLKKLAVLHLNTDWGRTSRDYFVKAAKEYGAEIVVSRRLYRRRARFPLDAGARPRRQSGRADPDLVLFRWRADRAAGASGRPEADDLRRKLGLFAEIPRAGRRGRRGCSCRHEVFSRGPAPGGAEIHHWFKAKYDGQEPDAFNAYSYDAMNMAAAVLRIGGTDRKAIRDAFAKVKDVPTVIFGPATFDVADAPGEGRDECRARGEEGPVRALGRQAETIFFLPCGRMARTSPRR